MLGAKGTASMPLGVMVGGIRVGLQEQEEEPEEVIDILKTPLFANWFPPKLSPATPLTCHAVPPRAGMSNPPQNPKVQRALLEYLQDCGMKPRAEPKPPSPSRGRSPSPKGQQSKSPVKGRGQKRSPSRPVLPRARSSPSLLDSKQEARQSSFEPASKARPPGDLEVSRYHKRLINKSREHGWYLDSQSSWDLGELNQLHNSVSRSKSSTTLDSVLASNSPSKKLKDLQDWMNSMDDWYKSGDSSPSKAHDSKASRPPPITTEESKVPDVKERQSMFSPGQVSPSRLLSLAQQVKHAGPSRIELLSRAAGLSVGTCARFQD